MNLNPKEQNAINKFIEDFPQFKLEDCEKMLKIIKEYSAGMVAEFEAYLSDQNV